MITATLPQITTGGNAVLPVESNHSLHLCVTNLFTTATTQVERGAYPYVRVEFVSGTSPSQIIVKGISLSY